MAIKNTAQRNLVDSFVAKRKKTNPLKHMNSVIDWSRVNVHFSGLYQSKLGEAAWPPLMMFKVLLLQSMHNLSDEKMEDMIDRDLVFMDFIGLSISEKGPDHSTINRFRNRLIQDGLIETLFNEVNTQLQEQGLIILNGQVSIVDATVIEAARSRPKKDKDGNCTQDPEAGFSTKKNAAGKLSTTYGFKAHVNADEDGFISKVVYTAANVHDSMQLGNLLTGHESAVYADKAYTSQKHDILLKRKGVKNCILKRGYRNNPLSKEDEQRNKLCSGVRQTVERVFGTLKLHYGLAKARYLGLQRNYVRFMFCAMAYNIKRAVVIQKLSESRD